MNVDLTTTNVLLGILACVQLVWLIAAAVGALYARRSVTRLQAAVARLEEQHVAPLTRKVERILGDVGNVAESVQHRAASVDAGLSTSYQAAERQARRVASVLNGIARETTAVATGVRAAVSAVAHPTSTHTRGVRDDSLHA